MSLRVFSLRSWRLPCLGGAPTSVRSCMLMLVLASLLPAALAASLLIVQAYQEGRKVLAERALSTSEALLRTVDAQIGSATAGLLAMASSPALIEGDLQAFHEQAMRALPLQSGSNFVLTDASGQQRVNTLVPYGRALPRHGDPALQRQVLAQDRPVVSDLFVGAVTRRPLVVVEVPVHVAGATPYTLAMGFMPDRFAALLKATPLEPEWVVSVFDRKGVVVARSMNPERFVGGRGAPGLMAAMAVAPSGVVEVDTLEGTPVIAAYTRSSESGWTVAVGVPRQVLLARLHRWIAWLLLGTLALLSLAAALAAFIGGRVAQAIGRLQQPAQALGRGEAVQAPASPLVEVNAIGDALGEAAQLLRRRTSERDRATQSTVAMRMRAQRFEHAARHDPLTGLPNRAAFEQALVDALAAAGARPVTLLFVDIDEFKPVNDVHGHAAGDELLRTAASRLRSGLREGDMVARLGGDEFAAVLQDVDARHAATVAHELAQRLSRPYRIRDVDVAVYASVGSATFPQDGSSAAELLALADARMYAAKALGKARRRA